MRIELPLRACALLACALAANAVLAATQVAPGIDLLSRPVTASSQPDGNSIVIDAPEGLIVFDTGRHSEYTQQIVDLARQRGRPIRAIVNSHWHLDHVGGNLALRALFPEIPVYASAAIQDALDGFLADYRRQLSATLDRAPAGPQADAWRAELTLIDAGLRLGPTEIVARSSRVSIGGRQLELHLARGATEGDVWVLDTKSRVLLAGDLVTLPVPFLDTACPQAWEQALGTLAKEKFQVLVPGHGPPLTKAQLGTYRKAFGNLVACSMSAAPDAAACAEGWMQDAASLIDAGERDYARRALAYYVPLIPGRSASCRR